VHKIAIHAEPHKKSNISIKILLFLFPVKFSL